MKSLFLFTASFFFFTNLFSQQIDVGSFNGWDFGPTSVHGNLLLTKTKAREYFKIEKKDNNTVQVRDYNPSGIVINTTTVSFVNGIISKVIETDQWGENYESTQFVQKDKNEFIVTDLLRGVNNFLPCKYGKYIYKDELLNEVQCYSFTGKLMENKSGYAIMKYKRYDDKIRFAEIKETSYYDAQGQPCILKSLGYHKLLNKFDDQDNKISDAYLGINEEPVNILGEKQAGYSSFYDSDNNEIKIEFHDVDNKVASNTNGVAIVEFKYINGYNVEIEYFDSLHQMVKALAIYNGLSKIKKEYDSSGNKTKESYFDEKNNPMSDHSGVHEIVYDYSKSNMLLKSSYFDDFEQPSLNRDKFHKIIYVRDKYCRIIQKATYDKAGTPSKDFSDDVYMLKYKYDEYGRKISTSFWRDSSTMMPRWDGTFEQEAKFNEDGQTVEFNYFDQYGNHFKNSFGSSMSKFIYNADGQISERQFLYNDTLTITKHLMTSGYSIIKYGYDKNVRVKELTFLDAGRKPVNATISIPLYDNFKAYRIEFIYKGSRIIEQLCYDTDNSNPLKTINCLENDFISTTGITIGRKNAN